MTVDSIVLTDEQRAQRAERLAAGPIPGGEIIWYFLDPELGVRNGGRDPEADHCASVWKDGNGKVWWTCDCVALTVYAQGWCRRPRAFTEYVSNGRGAINTDSMLADARRTESVVKLLTMPRRGCVITMPSIRKVGGGRATPGHTGVVVSVDPAFDPRRPDLRLVRVAHASPRNHTRFGQAIGVTDATVFGSRQGWSFLEFRTAPAA
jgi:hypothetical protein